MRNKKIAVSMVSLLACLAGSAVFGAATSEATSSTTSASLQEFRLQPAVDLWGYSGNNTLGEGQVRLPIYGDSSKVFYGLAEGNTAVNNNSWLGGGGLGYRQVVNNERIFGGYALVDYSNTANNNGFWIANPGLEMLGQVWNMNINGYIPFASKKGIGSNIWADDLIGANGINATDYIHFWDHNEGAHKFRVFEEMGNGFGAEVGRIIPSFAKAKLYVGGYHFDTDDMGSINGATARLTYGLNKYAALELKNTYDNVNHNKALFGVKLSFGGYSDEQKQAFGISSRLMDPVDNDFARLSASVGAIVKTKYVDQGDFLEHDNLWFFEPEQIIKNGTKQSSASGDGSYERPFVGFNQNNYYMINPNIGSIDKNPLMYFAPGSYAFTDPNQDKVFNLNNGWGMYGREADYKAPAMEDNRPTFNDFIVVGAGDEKTTLNSISIAPVESKVVLYVNSASNVVLQNIDMQGHLYGINAVNSTLNFEALNQSMDGTTTINAGSGANGILMSNSTINFNGGTNVVNGSGNSTGEGGNGIYMSNSTINFNGGKNIITGGSDGSNSQRSNNGIYVYTDGSSAITFAGGTNIISGGRNGNHSYTSNNGIYSETISGGSSIIEFRDGLNQINGGSVGSANSYGNNGIFAYVDGGSSAIEFKGGKNTIQGGSGASSIDNHNSNGIVSYIDSAAGSSVIDFRGGINQIYGDAATNNLFGINSNGISAIDNGVGNTTITFYEGSTNDIAGGYSSGTSTSSNMANSNGIQAYNVTITFNGGKNTILGGTSSNNDVGNSNGIMVTLGTINFNGGINNIAGGTSSQDVNQNSNGIYVHGSNVTFTDGFTTITGGTSNNQNLDPYSSNGIIAGNGVFAGTYADYGVSTITFANFGKPLVNISVIQDGADGIYADVGSSVRYEVDTGSYDFTKDNIDNISSYANFSFLGNDSTSSYAVYWDQNSPATPISYDWPVSKVAAK